MKLETHRAIELGDRIILVETSEEGFRHVAPLDMPDYYIVEIAASLDHRLVCRDEVKSAIEGGNS